MKKILIGTLAVAALSACSNDETLLEQSMGNNEISFAVSTENQSRAANVFCNNNMPIGFTVHAWFDGAAYITGDEISRDGAAGAYTWKNNSGTRYWPETSDDKKLDFYANVGGDFQMNDNKPGFGTFIPSTIVSEQVDLLYAVTKDQSKPADASTKVNLNFRHALSQIVFMAKNVNPDLYVKVSGVSVVNVAGSGTYTFPEATTATFDKTHENVPAADAARGQWTLATTKNAQYTATFTAVALAGAANASAVSLTSANDEGKEYSSNAMLLLPTNEPTTKYNVETKESGTYFLVECEIYNVADAEKGYQESDVCIWSKKNIMIPASFDWAEGMKYVYTFVFGKGNGGYTPEPDDPKPVLIPITFDVSVDEFVETDEQEITVGDEEEQTQA